MKFNQIYQSQIILLYLMCVSSSFAHCYQSVNGISLGLAQSDPNKQSLGTVSIFNVHEIVSTNFIES